ncbi:MAG: AfsR/SARP family transcriptional regulator [candidate division WOR-3 bacterium]
MNALSDIKHGMELFRAGKTQELAEHMRSLRAYDPIASDVLEVSVKAMRFQSPEAIRKGIRLLSAVSGRPELAPVLFNSLGIAYSTMGEIGTSENYYFRALEASEIISDRDGVFMARMNLFHIRFCRGEYGPLYEEIKKSLRQGDFPDDYYARYLLALLEVIRGEPDRVLKTLETLAHPEDKRFYYFGSLEIKGLALRLKARLDEAIACYEESAEGLFKLGTTYSVFPCAKALELARICGLHQPKRGLIRDSIRLATRGSWGDRAAAQAVKALTTANDEECLAMLFEAAQDYKKAYHLLEAFTSGLLAAYMAWQTESPLFAKILRFLSPMASVYAGFRRDPLLGEFFSDIYPLLNRDSDRRDEHGIRAYLIGDMRVLVDGKEIPFRNWRRKKAVRALIYLLLSPKHRLPQDHMFYLLWPRRKYDERSREGLYSTIYTIRKNIRRPELLTRRHDFYQLEDVWTDLDEIESLVRRAESATDLAEREELYSRARELAGDELLPEVIDDRYVEEYREYYNRLRKRITNPS